MQMSKLLTNYCSCVFQVKGKQGLAGKTAKNSSPNPYAVCAKSVLQGRGKPGPGAMACRFTKTVLNTYDVETLRGWLIFEGLVSKSAAGKLSKEAAAAKIHDYLVHKEPKFKIKVGKVGKRQSPLRKLYRARGQSPKAKRSPKPALRRPPGSPRAKRS